MTPSTTILKETAELFAKARINLYYAAKRLYEIKEKDLWKGAYSSFGEYVESECQISQSFAAKLIRVHGHYVLEGGVKADQIREVDTEKLYLALRLPGTPEAQLTRASTWTRSEIKAEIASQGGEECSHETTVTICAHCHARI